MTVPEIIKGLKTQLYEIILQYFKHYKHVLSGKLDGYDSNNREKSFTIRHFKRLLLNFIISNNISFKAIITLSFKKLLDYLNP